MTKIKQKEERTYTVFQLDPDYYENGTMRIREANGCGHKHKTFRSACRCCYGKAYKNSLEEWRGARIRENTSGYIFCEGSWDDFRDRVIYRTKYIEGKLFYTEKKFPECPPDIARLFDDDVRNALTPQELMVIDLKVLNIPEKASYSTPRYLKLDGLYRMIAYQNELGICDDTPYGTKSMENTCGVCGKTGFQKVVDPKTLYTHNQKCNACDNSIMIDSWYFAKHFTGKLTGRHRLTLVKGGTNKVAPNHRDKIYLFLPNPEEVGMALKNGIEGEQS